MVFLQRPSEYSAWLTVSLDSYVLYGEKSSTYWPVQITMSYVASKYMKPYDRPVVSDIRFHYRLISMRTVDAIPLRYIIHPVLEPALFVEIRVLTIKYF